MTWGRIVLLFLGMVWVSCHQQDSMSTTTLFTKLNSSATNIDFANHLTENDTLNYFNFPFLYLGGGVSVGDINNDGLPDIYFTGNQVSNRLYLNRGNLQFEDISTSAGVAGDERWYAGSTMVDINQDGWLDIYVSVAGKSGYRTNQLFINNQNNTFSEEATSYGVADQGTSVQSTFFDYDNDGLLDLFVANYPIVLVSAGNKYYKNKMDANQMHDSGHLYRNNGDGTFRDVTKLAGVQKFGLTLGIVASDFNNDGFTDLYLSNDFNVPDYLYQNNGDGTFSEISQEALRHTAMFGMGIDAADVNNDGLIDFFQLDMTAEDYKRSKTNMASMSPATFYEAIDLGFNHQYMQNVMQLNNGTNKRGIPVFSDISRLAGLATTDWSWGAIFADLNNDGWKDIFVTNGIKRDVNNNDVNAQYDAATFWGREANPDFALMPSTPISNYAFLNQSDFTFQNSTKELGLGEEGFSNGFAVTDLDMDGDLDIVINNIDQPASVYVNNTQNGSNDYLKIKFIGTSKNPFGLGTRVTVSANNVQQTQELTLTRGYQSSVDPIMHFGLGDSDEIDELEINWPNGNQQVIKKVETNNLLEIDYKNSSPRLTEVFKAQLSLVDITDETGIDFKHAEDPYDDFEIEPLLPHRTSVYGPGMSTADINGDNLDDIYVGNARGQAGVMYIQNMDGRFERMNGPWELDAHYEDTGSEFFDADGDGDLDLYVVSGGNNIQVPMEHYQDRLYINTPDGFIKAEQSFPAIRTSGQAVATADFDGDGDEDIFVGGRIVPGSYPSPPESFLLRNDGKDGTIHFEDVTSGIAPALSTAGMVTSALWDDFNQDGRPDLVLAGEWTPIMFFENHEDGFVDVTKEMGLADLIGWWYSMAKGDFDGDGDTDYFAGNLGLNYKYRASLQDPFEVYANDFDDNGSQDIVLSYKKGKKHLPLRGRECSSQQVPAIKIRFKTFEAFADASLEDIYGESMLSNSLHYKANTFAHHWFENDGNGKFIEHQLPNSIQFSSINSIQPFDYNHDDYPDLLIGGNLYHAEVETPRADASIGLVLAGSSSGDFVPVASSKSGLMLTGEIKHIQFLRLANNQPGFVVARNDLTLKVYMLSSNPADL